MHDQRRKTLGRFVHQQHARVGHQRAADGEHLLLAARERAGGLFLALTEARKGLEHRIERPLFRDLAACLARGDNEIFVDRQAGKNAPPLRHQADATA